MTALARIIGCITMVSLLSACANVAPLRPDGHRDYRKADLEQWSPKTVKTPKDTLPVPLVVGQVQDESIPPIGGLYNDREFAEAPLVEVYHLVQPGRLLADALPKEFRRLGAHALRDHSDLGDAVNADGIFPKGMLVLRIQINALTYARHLEGYDALLGTYTARLHSADTNEEVFAQERAFALRADWNMGGMMMPQDGFDVMAQHIAQALMAESSFVTRLGGSAQ